MKKRFNSDKEVGMRLVRHALYNVRNRVLLEEPYACDARGPGFQT